MTTGEPPHREMRQAVDEVQVYFLFDRTGPWPPVPSEGLRAVPDEGGYRLLETPFFVRNVARNDVVSAESDNGVLWAGERLHWAGHQTLRVTPQQPGTPTCAQVLAEFAALGVPGEDLEEYQLVALDVEPGVALQPVKDLLVRGQRSARWWYEEACVSLAWPSTGLEP